jgi:hypothetical protein
MLAQALYDWLTYVKKLNGYFWEKHSDPADVVAVQLQQNVEGSLVFLQILQSTLFERDPGEHSSYCLLEYRTANTDPSRVLVLLAEPFDDLIKPEHLLYEELEEWHDGLGNSTRLELNPVRTQEDVTAELERIGKIIKKKVDQARQRLITGAPA